MITPNLQPSTLDLVNLNLATLNLATIEWSTEPMFGSYLITSAFVLAMLVAWWVIRSDRAISLGKRITLAVLRLLMIGVLGLLLVRPALTLTRTSQMPHSIAVMVDTSTSMDLPSGVVDKSRWDIQKGVVEAIKSASPALGKEIQWQLFGYDRQLRRLSPSDSDASLFGADGPWATLPRKPDGLVTDVGQGLGQILETPADPPLLAVVWLGDGAQTVRSDTSKAQQAVRNLTQLDIPLFLVGIGPRSGSDQTRDQSVEGVPDQLESFAKNSVAVRGTLRAIGVQNQELKIQALLIPSGKKFGEPPVLLNQQVLTATSIDQTIPFSLPVVAPEKGLYQLLIKAVGVDGEATLLNNEQTCFLNVRDRGSRILYLEGSPGFEQKFIRQAVSDSPDLKIDFVWAPAAARKRWPLPLQPQLTGDTYDCVILGDLDADALGTENIKLLIGLIQRGAGLITLGGYHAYSSGGYAETELANILPVKLNKAWRQKFDKPDNLAGQIEGAIRLVPRFEHPIMMLEPDGLSRWKELKPLLGVNRWSGIVERPGVQWIAQGDASQSTVPIADKEIPLIVSGESGTGRVLSIAFDSSYLWWLQGRSDVHRQFWRQAVLWTMRRRPPSEGIQIDMSRRSYSLGESATYSILWTPGTDNREMPSDLQVRWSRDGVDLGPLVPTKENKYKVIGKLNSLGEAGRYEIIVRCSGSNSSGTDGSPIEVRLPFVVIDMAVEKILSAPDWQLINQLAKLNESAGGRVISPESTSEIISAIQKRRESATMDLIQTYRLGDGPIDSWIAFALLAGLLCIQWSLRKAWNLP